MKVLFIIRSLENGGAERQLALLANGLAARGHGAVIGVLYPGGVHEAALDLDRVRLLDLEKRSRWNLVGFMLRVLRTAASEKPDVIHGYLSAGNLIATLAHLACPSSRLVWGIRDSQMNAADYGWVTRTSVALLRLVARRVGLMIFNSEAGRRHWSALGYAARNSICIPNGIDTIEFAPDAEARLQQREAWQIPAGAPLVGMVARLDPAKDYEGFLRAAALVLKRKLEARFVCLGHGPAAERSRLQSLAVGLGIGDKVLWPAPTRNMRAVYNALDVFCLVSHAEGFPNVVAEAMACGKPSVVSDAGDAADIVGQIGRVVPTGNSAALAQAIVGALDEAPSAAIRQRILDRFTVESLALRTESALTQALQGRSSRLPACQFTEKDA